MTNSLARAESFFLFRMTDSSVVLPIGKSFSLRSGKISIKVTF